MDRRPPSAAPSRSWSVRRLLLGVADNERVGRKQRAYCTVASGGVRPGSKKDAIDALGGVYEAGLLGIQTVSASGAYADCERGASSGQVQWVVLSMT